jgi:hypothetical protein
MRNALLTELVKFLVFDHFGKNRCSRFEKQYIKREMIVLCLIGDIVHSRRLVQREQFQSQLRAALKSIQVKSAAKIRSPYTLTLGDEFQVVYAEARHVFSDLFLFLALIYPVKARFSFGVGPLHTRVNRKISIGMDGPAFYAARESLDILKSKNRVFWVSSKAAPEIPNWINPALGILGHVGTRWKKNRLLILHGMLMGADITTIARLCSLTENAVYKNIRSGALEDVVEFCERTEDSINKLISHS